MIEGVYLLIQIGYALFFCFNSAKPGKYDKLTGWKNIEKVIDIDQSPIGRTPRSNPATYTSVFDDIRTLFAQTNEAKMRGYTKARFSFNVKGGQIGRASCRERVSSPV